MPNVVMEPLWMLHPGSVHLNASEGMGMVNGTAPDGGHTTVNNSGRTAVNSVEVTVNGHASPVAERRGLKMGKWKKKKKPIAPGAPGEGGARETTETTHGSKKGKWKWKKKSKAPPFPEAPPPRKDWERIIYGSKRDKWKRMKTKAPPFPKALLFPEALPRGDDEDWEREIMTPPVVQDPYGPEDVLGAPLRSLALSQALPPDTPGPALYSPSADHPRPLTWVRHIQRIVAEQFDDAEE